MFADLVGFTSIAERLDPEEVYALVDACASAFRSEIQKHEGWLDKLIGDGVMALFGAPVMHEDDPARALFCALGMQAAVKRLADDLRARHGLPLQIRIGLHLGRVVVGEIGSDLMQYTALGDCVNVASRLQSVAEPGAILVSRSVYEQTRANFEFRELGSIRLRGRVQPVDIFEMQGPRRESGRVRGIPGLAAPIIGRDREQQQIGQLLHNLLAGGVGSAVLITGEPGIGKSRLISELKREAIDHAVRVHEAGCLAYGQPAYGLFVKLLWAALGLRPEEDPTALQEQVASRVRSALSLRQPLADVLPYIEHLLGLPIPDQDYADRIRHLDAAQLRRQTFLAVRDFLVALARSRPLVLIFEDLHWIDRLSLDLLRFLLNSVETAPLCLVCSARPLENDIAAQLSHAGESLLDARFLKITLAPLSIEESARLVGLLLTLSELPEALRSLIDQRGEGNPFFLEEIIRMLIDRDIIVRKGEHWEMTPSADLSALQVPLTLEGLIMARVDHLPEATRQALQCASVIGREFDQELLRRIVTGARLDERLQELQDHELILSVPERTGRYSFRHILTQQTVYNSLLIRRRELLHHKIAEAIEDLYGEDLGDQTERIAFHYAQSRDASRALPYLLRAGERAAGRYANDEALRHYRTALSMADGAPASLTERIQIHLGAGDAESSMGNYDDALSSYRQALELARAQSKAVQPPSQVAGIARRLGRVLDRRGEYPEALRWLGIALAELDSGPAAEQTQERARTFLDTGWVHYHLGQIETARTWLDRALCVSQESGHYAEMATAYNRLAALFIDKGDWPHAQQFAANGLALRERIGDTDGLSRSHLTLGASAALQGNWGEAIRHFEASLELSRRLAQPKGISDAYTNLGSIYLLLGDAAQAREFIRLGLETAEKVHDQEQVCQALNALAEAELSDGHWDAAHRNLQASIKIATEMGAKERLAQAAWILAEAHLGDGRHDLAEQSARHALDLARQIGVREIEASAYRVLGAVLRADRRWQEGEGALARSIGIFNDLSNPFEAARAELELALLYQEEGIHLDARSLLKRSLDTFSRFNAARYRERAAHALAPLDAPAASG